VGDPLLLRQVVARTIWLLAERAVITTARCYRAGGRERQEVVFMGTGVYDIQIRKVELTDMAFRQLGGTANTSGCFCSVPFEGQGISE
jgi:hypothetical protein